MQHRIDPRCTVCLTFIIFGMQPFVLGAWFVMIPFVKASLSLSKTELALTFPV